MKSRGIIAEYSSDSHAVGNIHRGEDIPFSIKVMIAYAVGERWKENCNTAMTQNNFKYFKFLTSMHATPVNLNTLYKLTNTIKADVWLQLSYCRHMQSAVSLIKHNPCLCFVYNCCQDDSRGLYWLSNKTLFRFSSYHFCMKLDWSSAMLLLPFFLQLLTLWSQWQRCGP